MKKLLCIVLVIFFSLGLANISLAVGIDADSEITGPIEEKVFSNATMDDDFADDQIIVIITNSASLKFKEYTVADFSEIPCSGVRDLMPTATAKAEAKERGVDVASLFRTTDNAVVTSDFYDIDTSSFRQILCLTLSDPVVNLVLCIVIVYGLFGLFQSKGAKGRSISAVVIVAAICGLVIKYNALPAVTEISAPIFQQFNACFVVMLTPVSIALFSALGKRGKEPSAPLKIGLGMLVAGVAYILMTVGSIGLPSPAEQTALGEAATRVSPNWLISTYLILTFAELLLSPIGISFVTKVAPPKYAGMMMGGWFVATAIGNFLVAVPAMMWGKSLTVVWGTLIAICLVAAFFIFIILKRLEKVAK